MYATPSPHASAVPLPGQPLTQQTPATHGHPQHAHTGLQQGGMQAQTMAAPAVAAPRQSVGAAFMTGAYQSSGDPMIDRMVRLEAACKRFGGGF